jgi:hypothetical protein
MGRGMSYLRHGNPRGDRHRAAVARLNCALLSAFHESRSKPFVFSIHVSTDLQIGSAHRSRQGLLGANTANAPQWGFRWHSAILPALRAERWGISDPVNTGNAAYI